MNAFEFLNYREYLRACLAERQERNRGYSLRAMARDLGLANSTLSEAINGRANLSVDAGRKVASALKLNKKENNYFCDLVQLDLEKDPEGKEVILDRLKKSNSIRREVIDLSVEQFKLIADWYHHAILELSLIRNFELTPANVARALKIPVPTAHIGIERLEKLNLLTRTETNKLIRTKQELRLESKIRNKAMRQMYRQMFEKAAQALEDQTPQERLSGFLSLPINPKALPDIDDAITRFFEDVRRISSQHGDESDVYHLMLHFFNLTQNLTQHLPHKEKKGDLYAVEK